MKLTLTNEELDRLTEPLPEQKPKAREIKEWDKIKREPWSVAHWDWSENSPPTRWIVPDFDLHEDPSYRDLS